MSKPTLRPYNGDCIKRRIPRGRGMSRASDAVGRDESVLDYSLHTPGACSLIGFRFKVPYLSLDIALRNWHARRQQLAG
jgi:hypothetical protein